MNPRHLITRIVLPVAVLGLALAGCSSAPAAEDASPAPSSAAPSSAATSSPAPSSPAPQDQAPSPASDPGAYVTWAEYEADRAAFDSGDVVLFFHADWCPTCQGTEQDLTENAEAIPTGLTIVKVDYDDSDDLKRTYGVTTQHTFVQIDADGAQVAKWTGSQTSADIAASLA